MIRKVELLGNCSSSTYVKFHIELVKGNYSFIGVMRDGLMRLYVVPDLCRFDDRLTRRILREASIYCASKLCLRHLVMHGEFSLYVDEFSCGDSVLDYCDSLEYLDFGEYVEIAEDCFKDVLGGVRKDSYRVLK